MATKHGRMTCYRTVVCATVLLLLLFSRGKTEQIAPIAAAMVLAICAGLIFAKGTRLLTLPFLLLSLILIFCYDSFSVFIGYLWLLPVVLLSIGVYLWRLRPRLILGPSFLPLCAVALATVLSGVGMITADDYFRPISLFYVFALGPGMVLVYLLLKNCIASDEDERSFVDDLFALAVVAALVILVRYLVYLPDLLVSGRMPQAQWANNISTLLMLSFPLIFVRARRHYGYLLLGLGVALLTMLSGSNGALLLVPVEVSACLLWLWLNDDRPIARLWNRLLLLLAVGGALLICLLLLRDASQDMRFSLSGREGLFKRGIRDFLENPIFGSGIGYRGNADLYSGKEGTVNWYHLFLIQVVGGMGVVGILSWGAQLLVRARLAARVFRTDTFALALCYFGLFLMSMVNPGEFCPIPYGFLAVMIFFCLERHAAEPYQLPWKRKKDLV